MTDVHSVQTRSRCRQSVRHDGRPSPVFFNAAQLPPPIEQYVAWVDVMGTKASMSTSLRTTANFMFKLHIAAFRAPREQVRVYPVMDGFYAAAVGKTEILNFLRSVFATLGAEFNSTEENRFRFLVRGGLAFGPSIHGADVPRAASAAVADASRYRDSILLGMPMVQANTSEAEAPPFGICVHESARAFAPTGEEPLHDRWWRWDEFGNGLSSGPGQPCRRTSSPTSTGAPTARYGSAIRWSESTSIARWWRSTSHNGRLSEVPPQTGERLGMVSSRLGEGGTYGPTIVRLLG